MRSLVLLPILALAACGGEPEKEAAPAAASTMEAGQWTLASEVTSVDSLDKTEPAIKAAVGDKAEGAACLAEADVAKPQPAVFVGEDAGTCNYENFYMSRGRLNATLGCKKEGIDGDIQISLEGTYGADSFDVTARTQTYLPGPGDVAIGRQIKGTKTAAQCAAPAADGAEAPKA